MKRLLLAITVAAATLAISSCQAPAGDVPRQPQTTPAVPTTQASAPGAKHPGEAVYAQSCAACHDQPDATRAPSKETLKAMSFQALNFALTKGKMKVQGSALSEEARGQLISYLIGRTTLTTDTWTAGMMCKTKTRLQPDREQAAITTFGFDIDNTRSLTSKQAGLNKSQLSKMELAWAIGFPDATTMRSQGAVVGKHLYLPVADASAMYAFDISNPVKPCIEWIYRSPGDAPLRTSAAFQVLPDGTPLLVFSGLDSTVHAVDARTGKALWAKNVASYSFSTTTGTPVVLKDRVIVPVAQFEILFGSNNRERCCTNHGYVLSLDPKTGEQQWRYDTMPDATTIRDRGDGQALLGPSGAPIWNSPLVDEKRGLVYFGTGEANSPPAHKNTNALIAIGLKDGKERWSYNATPQDIFLSGCTRNPKPEQLNCVRSHETVYRDVDFGASLVMGHLKDGQELVFAGQKSGSVWALNPDSGAVVWRTVLGTGGALGGVHWGIAFDRDTLFVPISTVGSAIAGEWDGDPNIKPGLYALDAKTGKIKWQFNPVPPPGTPLTSPEGRAWRGAAMSAAPAVIDGVVVTATLDGTLFAFDADTGQNLWTKPTAKPFDTLNGVPGKGGSVDSASLYAANGLLLANSGYGMFGQVPGNVLLAYKPVP